MQYVDWQGRKVSRFIIGSNQFSGFSHQGVERDNEMRHYYTVARIKETLFAAEKLGVNTIISRTDHHVMRFLMEYHDEGGTLQWFAQTCPEVSDSITCAKRAASSGAVACHIHGGVMDYLVAQGKTDDAAEAIKFIRDQGMLAGIAGHSTRVFEWAEDHLDVDYYMCCYYNPTPRDLSPGHNAEAVEHYLEKDRTAMTTLIPSLSKPAIHYKILAAGRNAPAESFTRAAATMRDEDTVCVGVYSGDNDKMLEDDVRFLDEGFAAATS